MNADALFDSLSNDLLDAGATPSTMFGKRSLTIKGKAFVCLKGDLLAFRLGAGSHEHQDALALRGAELFDPPGEAHPFKDWVAIPVANADHWPQLGDAAIIHTKSLAAGK